MNGFHRGRSATTMDNYKTGVQNYTDSSGGGLYGSTVHKTWRATHQQQMDGFLYTLFILMFYAVTMLYFMLRQICRQERRNREQFYRLRFVTSDYAVAKEERMHRSQMKKQLCVHLIKMGQLTQAFVSTANKAALNGHCPHRPICRGISEGYPGESDSNSDEKERMAYRIGQSQTYWNPGTVKKLTRDQATITDDIFTTIIDIETESAVDSDVSL